jgi:hypothetical protein
MEFQLKHPFNLLQTDRDGALIAGKWGILDLNHRTPHDPQQPL